MTVVGIKYVKPPPAEPNRICRAPQCGKRLYRYYGKSRYWKTVGPVYGYRGNNWFCSLQCAAWFGIIRCDSMSDPD